MDVNKFNQLVDEFNIAAEAAKLSLTQMLGKITAGRCVSEEEAEVYQSFVNAMNKHYRAAVAEAQACLSVEELPEEGSPLADYVSAFQESSAILMQKRIEQIKSVLEPFIRIQSVIRFYAEALRPYQDIAEKLLASLQDSSLQISDLETDEYNTDAQALFLQCVEECADETDEGLEAREELLDRVHALFPERRIYDGLIAKRYYIANDHIVKHAVMTVDASETDTPADAPEEEKQPDEEPNSDSLPETGSGTGELESACPLTDDAADAVLEEAGEALSDETDTEYTSEYVSEVAGWESVGITDPTSVSCSADAIQIERIVSPKASSSFGVKAFKSEKMKCRGSFLLAISAAFDFSVVVPELMKLSAPREVSLDEMNTMCQTLFRLGYLDLYRSSNGTDFYSLSNKGKQIFHHHDSAKLLSTTKSEFLKKWKDYEEDDRAILLRLVYVRSFQRCFAMRKGINNLQMLPDFGTYTFDHLLNGFFDDQRNLLFLSVISDEPNGFQELLSLLKYADLNKWSLLVIGITREHAAALTAWLKAAVAELQNKQDVYYMDDSDGTVYSCTGELIPDLPTYSFDQNDKPPEELPEPDIPFESEKAVSGDENISVSKEQISPDVSISVAESESLPDRSAEYQTADMQKPEEYEKLTESLHSQYTEKCMKMLASGKHYCATAYARVLAERYPKMESFYKQLAYAYNDPLEKCQYSSDMIFDIYFAQTAPITDYLVIAAVLRNYFYDQCPYDYSIPQLQDAISSNLLFAQNSALHDTVYKLMNFKMQQHHGIDYCADYRQQERMSIEKSLHEVIAEAAVQYKAYIGSNARESVQQKRFLETKKILFDKNGDLAICLEYVVNDERESVELIAEHLRNHVIREGCVITDDNIDQEKINYIIQRAWNDAGKLVRLEKKSSDLMGRLHNNLFKAIEKIAQILCRYVMLLNGCSAPDNSPEQMEYTQIRTPLLQCIDKAITFFESDEKAFLPDICGKQIIQETLTELRHRLDGTYNEAEHNYFYIDFLKNQWVLLHDNYMPVFDEVFELSNLSILARIERHYSEPDIPFETRMQEIMEGEDDYGSARLIAHYLKQMMPDNPVASISDESIDEAAAYARADIENKRNSFMEELELRHAYGQIDNTKSDMKESFVQIMDIWYRRALADQNYGFFDKIRKGIFDKIEMSATTRAASLQQDLEVYLAEHKDAESDERVSRAVKQIRERIDRKNYAAAEDLLNRLSANDFDTAESLIETDYLQEFLEHYQEYTRQAGSTGNSLKNNMNAHNKDVKGGNRLFENWPSSSSSSQGQIKALMTALGFSVSTVTPEKPIKDKNSYHISLNQPENGRKSAYTHPIAAFGSDAENDGFRVVTVFGKMDATRLIDLMNQIGSAYNTMILLDYSLSLPDRRELARKTKTLHLAGKCFIVVDRLVIVYLARHYSDNAVNRMLMALTVPFSSCQPYVYDSAHIMPPEIFMGRRRELSEIESEDGVHIVYGGRQLGKSALLRKAQADVNNDEKHSRAVLVDIKGRNYIQAARKISEELIGQGILDEGSQTEDWEQLATMIKKRLRDTSAGRNIPYLLLLLDEADVFIESCDSVDYKPLEELKDIESIGSKRFKFVIAGLRNIIRFKKNVLKKNKVLTHLSSMTVLPFRAAEARELLEIPLSYLGFRFPNDANTETLISTILGTTNYFPGLLQLYCAKLIESLQRNYAGYDESDAPPYVLKEEQIRKALADSTLVKQIREKFIITLKLDDDDYYYLIALLAAYHYHNNDGQNGSRAEDIRELAEFYEISKLTKLSTEQIQALMEEMRELNVFQKTGSNRYRFARLSFCQMMGSIEQIEDDILKNASENGG